MHTHVKSNRHLGLKPGTEVLQREEIVYPFSYEQEASEDCERAIRKDCKQASSEYCEQPAVNAVNSQAEKTEQVASED